MSSKRVLFFAEAVTLAHVARPIALAKALAGSRYDAYLACDSRYRHLIDADVAQVLPLTTIPGAQFLKALEKGKPVYSLATLHAYLEDDLALIEQVKPDLIIGDFRLSLSVSARIANIPYAAITNAYWSPHYRFRHFPLPVLPLTKALPIPLAKKLFRAAQPFAFPAHCRALNALRTAHGLPSLGNDLRRIYTDADHLLHADDPALFPLEEMPATHHGLGPLPWSPSMPAPTGWDALDAARQTVYLTLGSSGSPAVARKVVAALEGVGVNVIAAMAGGMAPTPAPQGMIFSDYVPGEQAAARSQLVICNGGSPTSQQALAAGVPVLGIAQNMDQFLNMDGLVRAGLGRMMRADRIDRRRLRKVIAEMLGDQALHERARRYAGTQRTGDLAARVQALVGSIIGQASA